LLQKVATTRIPAEARHPHRCTKKNDFTFNWSRADEQLVNGDASHPPVSPELMKGLSRKEEP
jgi:hypothetical protein